MNANTTKKLNTVFQYHQQTKHSFNRYADGPGYLDWANQPDPFRRYHNAKLIQLPFETNIELPLYDSLYYPGQILAKKFNLDSIACFLRNSMALSAWKQAGESRWSLRVNPSSGNLHPTEAYLLCGAIENLTPTPMITHYAPREHGLEKRCEISEANWQELTGEFEQPVLLMALTSIHWREAWKYGARAYRYCHLDAGHALAAISLSAASLGWHSRLLANLSHQQLRLLLGLPEIQDEETEQPDCLLAITPYQQKYAVTILPDDVIKKIEQGQWLGRANRLSADHVSWQAIENVAEVCEKPVTKLSRQSVPTENIEQKPQSNNTNVKAHTLFQQRRSAMAMDGVTSMPSEQFYNLLTRLMPDRVGPPFNLLIQSPQVHLLLFVHLVTGLNPGLYFLVRHRNEQPFLKTQLREEFAWTKPPDCPDQLPLYCLTEGDARLVSRQLSCQQAIASDGCFSLGMLTRFESTLCELEPWVYPQLYWECGAIGQVLYLEAEACGIQGTGIGCFFDDPVHELIGLKNQEYQILYHFTIGGAVHDPRLITLSPYGLETPDNDASSW